ncbi:MAG: exo-alpha-sialidase [Clostridia bacterium]|nr:exo-alpha-sialidase [Clostridia bacterium]
MKTATSWNYAPYAPPFHDAGDPYVTRIVPGTDSIHVEWLDKDGDTYRVFWRVRKEEEFKNYVDVTGDGVTIDGLACDLDYEVLVCHGANFEKQSRIRLARTGEVFGTPVNYLHPIDRAYSFSGEFLCSPSMVRHPDGYLLASMDLFHGKAPQNLTLIFRSDDDGETWHYVSELFPCYWGKLFVHRGELYMISVSTEYGDLLIGRSDDGGKTFATPTVLLRGSCCTAFPGVHKTPMPMLTYNGRLWMTLEWGCWTQGYHAVMVGSIDENADLLDPKSWTFTDPVKYDPTWNGVAEGGSRGNIEGCLTVFPNGELYNVMRYDMLKCTPNYGRFLAYKVNTDDPSAPLTYSHPVFMDGNHSKAEIHRDPETGMYYSIISRILDSEHTSARNLLSLMRSPDCKNWELACDLLDKRDEDPAKVGFQYVSFFIEGNDILYLCRTAMNNAVNFHDSNYITFHRIKNFREI